MAAAALTKNEKRICDLDDSLRLKVGHMHFQHKRCKIANGNCDSTHYFLIYCVKAKQIVCNFTFTVLEF